MTAPQKAKIGLAKLLIAIPLLLFGIAGTQPQNATVKAEAVPEAPKGSDTSAVFSGLQQQLTDLQTQLTSLQQQLAALREAPTYYNQEAPVDIQYQVAAQDQCVNGTCPVGNGSCSSGSCPQGNGSCASGSCSAGLGGPVVRVATVPVRAAAAVIRHRRDRISERGRWFPGKRLLARRRGC